MIKSNRHVASKQRRERPQWTSANLNLLAYTIKEGLVPGSRAQHRHGRLRRTSDRDDGGNVAILAENSVHLSKLCALTALLEQDACEDDVKVKTKFRFCGSSIRLVNCAIFSWGPRIRENDLEKSRLSIGYLHHAIPAQWRQNRGPNDPLGHPVDPALRLFSIWLCQDRMREYQDRQILCALLAVAQHMSRVRAMHVPACYLARLLVTKANDAEFIYLYVAHVASNTLDMLENATAHSEGAAQHAITERKIAYAPYNNFRDRLMVELQKPLLYQLTADVASSPG